MHPWDGQCAMTFIDTQKVVFIAMVTYQANSNYVLRRIAAQDVLVAVGAGVADFRGYITMNESATEIWKVLKNRVTEEEVVESLLKVFDAPREEVAKDVHYVLRGLVKRNMVTEYAE